LSSDDPTGAVLDLAGRLACDLVILAAESVDKPPRPARIDSARLTRRAAAAVCVVSMPQVPDRIEG
jgi:hypothetical protein